jgi:flagellar hook-associated protein 3 FlgL
MRVTEPLVNQLVGNRNSAAKASVFATTEKVITGKNFESIGDSLISAQRILNLDDSLARLERFQNSKTLVESDLRAVDGALITSVDLLIMTKEIAIQMSNESLNANDRIAEAEAVLAIKEQLVDIANTQVADGRYLFSGIAETTPPFDDLGNYQGSLENRTVEIAPGFEMQMTTPGTDAYGDPSAISVLDNFVTALQANDLVTIKDMMTQLDDAIHTLSVEHTSIGGRLKNTMETQDILDDLRIQFETQRSEIQDVDLARAISDMTNAETAMTAVVEASKRLRGATALRWLS